MKKDILYFAIKYLGVPYSLTKTNLKNYLFFGMEEGHTEQELINFVKGDK